MVFNKSGLITKVPFQALCKGDRDKVLAIDQRYHDLIISNEKLSWQQLREKIKPYYIQVDNNDCAVVVLAKTKKDAINNSDIPMSSISKITVEYKTGLFRELTTPKSKRKY